MKVLHVTPAFFPATYWGGPVYSTYGLCNSLSKLRGVELKVLTTDSAGPNAEDRLPVRAKPELSSHGYEIYYLRRLFGSDIAPELFLRLTGLIRWSDLVHVTGVYSSPTIPTLAISKFVGRPVVWSPRGSLQRWEGSTRVGAKEAWESLCNRLLRRGRAVLHVTSDEEATASVARIPRADVVLIPNGVEMPQSRKREWRPGGLLRTLYIGRLHPIKGIENLLAALVEDEFSHITLKVCGDGDPGYRAVLVQRVEELGLTRRVRFVGQVSGEAKCEAFFSADLCVVPSYTENFGIVVAESLAHGVPVIVSKGAPWSGVETHGCGLWVENSPAALGRSLRAIAELDLPAMGRRGREWMSTDYGWEAIATRMRSIYELLGKDGFNRV